MRKLCFALAFLLMSSEACAQWPLSVSTLGAPTLPTLWEQAGSTCRPELHYMRQAFVFNQSECAAAYHPRTRVVLGGPAYRREARSAKADRIVPRHLATATVAQAAPK